MGKVKIYAFLTRTTKMPIYLTFRIEFVFPCCIILNYHSIKIRQYFVINHQQNYSWKNIYIFVCIVFQTTRKFSSFFFVVDTFYPVFKYTVVPPRHLTFPLKILYILFPLAFYEKKRNTTPQAFKATLHAVSPPSFPSATHYNEIEAHATQNTARYYTAIVYVRTEHFILIRLSIIPGRCKVFHVRVLFGPHKSSKRIFVHSSIRRIIWWIENWT